MSRKRVPLTPVDNYFWRFEADWHGEHRVLIVLRLEGHIEADLLTVALEQLQRRHPKLRARIDTGDDGRLYYHVRETAPPIPFEIIDCCAAETPWRETARRLLLPSFPVDGPLAAAAVLRNAFNNCSELLLTLPHMIADGVSAIMLVDNLLTEYHRAEASLALAPDAPLQVVTAPRAKAIGGWRGRLRLLRRFIRLVRQEGRLQRTSLPVARDVPSQSQWVHWVFSREETVALFRRCRREEASVNGMLLAAACRALMDCLPAAEAVFNWQLPLNIRERLEGSEGPVTASDLGCFASLMNGFWQVSRQSAFWDLARRAHQEAQMFSQNGGLSFGYNASSGAYRLNMALGRMLKRGPPKIVPPRQRVTLLVTHYGTPNIRDSYGSLRPKECTLNFKNESTGPSLVMEALVLGQRLNLGFAAAQLEPQFWDKLQTAVRSQLHAAVQRMSVAPQE